MRRVERRGVSELSVSGALGLWARGAGLCVLLRLLLVWARAATYWLRCAIARGKFLPRLGRTL